MSDHFERACFYCGSLLHHEDDCSEDVRALDCEMASDGVWQIGNCEACYGPLYATNVTGMTLPVKGQRHPWCR